LMRFNSFEELVRFGSHVDYSLLYVIAGGLGINLVSF